jgi:acid phosphatase type 7
MSIFLPSPKQAEAGGLASGSELYYSFDYANIHFVCLDSFLSDRSPAGPMLTWLKNDLALTDKAWIIAFWHHPPYSWGTHNSDGEFELIEMRKFAVPILEAYGVDLVLSGHSHNYERSFLLDGHYGFSSELQPSMLLNTGLGRVDVGGPYRKPAGGLGARNGAVYTVCGCSSGGSMPAGHPVMAVNHGGSGSLMIDVNDLQLTVRFLRPSGEIDDYFTIDKSEPATTQPEMDIARATNGVVISWPTSHPEFSLQRAPSLLPVDWESVDEPASTIGRRKVVNIEPKGTNQFFRLRSTQ